MTIYKKESWSLACYLFGWHPICLGPTCACECHAEQRAIDRMWAW